ncbi:MAG: FAD-dependent oxidoreductase, partial [Microbacterium sp.]
MNTSPGSDVVVVGGGLAGLAAASRLAARGLRVTLLEKRAQLGGSSAMSGGWFALSNTTLQERHGVADSDEQFLADMVETGRGVADVSLLRAMVGGQERAIDAIDRADAWTDELKVSAGMTVPRAHLVRI